MGGETRGKDPRRIDKFVQHLERNHRLSWVFSICQDLGIDDPINWMNNTSSVVVDWWIAYKIYRSDQERAAYEKVSGKEKKTTFSGSDHEGLGKYLRAHNGGKG